MIGNKTYTNKYDEALRRARIEYGKKTGQKFTQEKLAEALGISVESIRDWEQGRRPPNGENLFRLCELYDCDMDYLTGRIECSTHDIQFIHDQTGLSESAIRKLQDQQQLPFNTADTLSRLIDHRLFVKLMQTIRKLIFGSKKTYQEAYGAYLVGGPYVDSPDDLDPQAHFEIYRMIANMTDELKECQK